MKKFFEFFLIFLSAHQIISIELQSNFVNRQCFCKLTELEIIEKLNKDLRRIRIDRADGLKKYSVNHLSLNHSIIECNSSVLYEVLNDANLQHTKKCRKCTRYGWTDLETCQIIRCDRDSLIGFPTLKRAHYNNITNEQKLFMPGEVVAEYNFTGGSKLCKECQKNGEWSMFSDPSHCIKLTTVKPNLECKYDSLKELEYNQIDYLRIRIESPDGLFKINEFEIKDNKLPSKTIVLYQRYLSNLPNATNRLKELDLNYYSYNVFTKKYCRYCEDGSWSELESCVTFYCDREKLAGIPEILSIPNNSRLPQKQTLIKPYSAIAIYKFGSLDKFCKICHENGEWSKYSLKELCNINKPYIAEKKLKSNVNREIFDFDNKLHKIAKSLDQMDLYKNENDCNFNHLAFIENKFSKITRLFFVSSDRKSKLNPTFDAKFPSRTISIYKKYDEERLCSVCINGIWSNITPNCTTDTLLYFCEKEKLGSINADPKIIVNLKDGIEENALESQSLFQPGSVIVRYDLSSTTSICKLCHYRNENKRAYWSKYSIASFCDPKNIFSKKNSKIGHKLTVKTENFNFCSKESLKEAETKDLIREGIFSFDAKLELTSLDIFPDSSIAVYKSISQHPEISNLKWCKKCSNEGRWDSKYFPCPIEFSIKRCDPKKLIGVDYFVYGIDGSKLSDESTRYLMLPDKIFAVYEFGSERYCKKCEDGNWSSYPQYDICNLINWT